MLLCSVLHSACLKAGEEILWLGPSLPGAAQHRPAGRPHLGSRVQFSLEMAVTMNLAGMVGSYSRQLTGRARPAQPGLPLSGYHTNIVQHSTAALHNRREEI